MAVEILSCPKCGTTEPMKGPRYSQPAGPGGREFLSYWCGTCGYDVARPCRDAKPEPVDAQRERVQALGRRISE